MQMLDMNREISTRAQALLTVDGVLITAFGAIIASSPDDLRKVVAVFGLRTWIFLGLAGAALVFAVLSAAISLRSLHRRGPSIDASNRNEYKADNMWFYGHIAQLDRERFLDCAQQADASWEARARLVQAAIISPLILNRAKWLNRGFTLTALGLTFVAVTAADYLSRLA
jgi:hypothetical protein